MKVLITNKGKRFRLGALEKVAKLSNGEARAFKLRGCLDVERERGEFLISKGFARPLQPVEPVVLIEPEPEVVTQVITEEGIVTNDVVPDPVEVKKSTGRKRGRDNGNGGN